MPKVSPVSLPNAPSCTTCLQCLCLMHQHAQSVFIMPLPNSPSCPKCLQCASDASRKANNWSVRCHVEIISNHITPLPSVFSDTQQCEMLHPVHSLLLTFQVCFWRPLLRSPSTVPWMTKLEGLPWRVTCLI